MRGGDAYLKDGVISKLKSLVPDESLAVNYLRFEEDAKVSDITAAAGTFSFFEEKKIILYAAPQNAKMSESDKSVLAEYCKNPCETTVLVIDDDGGFVKFLDKYAEKLDCSPPDNAFISRWLKNSLAKSGFSIDNSAVETLVRFCNCDMMRLDTEVKKLTAYAAAQKNVTAADVSACVAPDAELQVYELTNCLSKRDNKKSVEIYNILVGRGESPAMLLSMMTSQFRRIMYALLSPLGDSELAALFKVKEYSIVVARRMSANFSKLKLKRILDNLTLSEYLFKSGVISDRAALELSFAYLLTI
jgi:DNA polymerase-3 subunit delta